jgi:hypothetical protein
MRLIKSNPRIMAKKRIDLKTKKGTFSISEKKNVPFSFGSGQSDFQNRRFFELRQDLPAKLSRIVVMQARPHERRYFAFDPLTVKRTDRDGFRLKSAFILRLEFILSVTFREPFQVIEAAVPSQDS